MLSPFSPTVRRAAVVSLLVIHGLLAWLGRAPGIMTGQDDANYLLLASSLESGHYRDQFLVSEPLHRRYPPGYPAFLAVLDLLPGDRADVAIAANVLLSVATLGLAFGLFRSLFNEGIALAGLAVAVFNPYLVLIAGVPLSESLYTLLTVTVLIAATRPPGRPRQLALAGALAIAAALTRSVGLTLLLALGLVWLLQRRFRPTLVLAVIGAVTVGGWLYFSFAEPAPEAGWSYGADFAGGDRPRDAAPEGTVHRLLRRIRSNGPAYGAVMVPGMLPIPLSGGSQADNIAATLLFLVGLGLGGAALVRSGAGVIPTYILGYLALLMIWPYRSERFPMPLLPLLIPVTLAGLHRAARLASARAGVVAVTVIAVGQVAWGGFKDIEFVRTYGSCRRDAQGLPSGPCMSVDQQSFFAAVPRIQAVTPPDAVFFFAKPEPLFYYTGRRSVDMRPVAAGTNLGAYLEAKGVDWVLLGSLQFREWRQLPELLRPLCGRLAVDGFFPPRTYLFRVATDSVPGAPGCQALDDVLVANRDRGAEERVPR